MEKITRENWPEDWGQVQPWTPVDEEVYNHFLNTLPPVTFYGDRFQAGEAYDDEYDSYGRCRPRYLTFANCGSDGYFCLGLRFRNDYPLRDVEAIRKAREEAK